MAGLLLPLGYRALDANGDPISGAKAYTYVTGTTTNKTTYTTSALSVAHANPVVADSEGYFPDIWAPSDSAYRVKVTDAAGTTIPEGDHDPIYGLGATSNPSPRAITTTTSLTSDDINKTLRYSGTFTVTRPLGTSLTAGFKWRHVNEGTGTVTLATSGSDTADIATLYATDAYDEEWDGTTWQATYIGGGQGKYMLPIPATAMRANTTNGAELAVAEMTTNKQMVASFNFDTATQEYVQFSFPMPKSWDEGTISARFVWSHGATTVNFGVAWALQALAVSDGDALDSAWGTAVTVTDTGGTTNTLYITSESSAITIAGTPQEGDSVYFRIYREVANAADTMAVDAKLHSIHLFLTTNAPNDR